MIRIDPGKDQREASQTPPRVSFADWAGIMQRGGHDVKGKASAGNGQN